MTTPEPAVIDIRLLGPVEALVRGQPAPLGGPRQRALLALLAVEPHRVVSVDRLIDELWAGEPPAGAEITLRSYVSRLRSALGPEAPILASSAGYVLQVDAGAVDAARFERVTRDAAAAMDRGDTRGAADRLATALREWRGRPFHDLAVGGGLQVEAERLVELQLHALELRIEADLANGASGDLVDELEALVRQHPYRETFWRQLMLALYRSERQADALAAYHRARAALDEQLGLEPGLGLRELEAAILRQDVPEATPPEERGNLPASLSTFVGRERELAEVARLVADGRLVTLVGVGGVGKTRLALEAGRRMTVEFPDGTFFVDLAPLADPALMANLVGTTLQVREQAGGSPVEGLVRHLRASAMLLVLDNCEHLRGGVAEMVARLLEGCPRLKVLATSREVLGVPGEVGYAVPPLTLATDPGDSAAARTSESVRLFLARARESRPDLVEDDATVATVARICADLDGLPLGIELAAARSRALSPAEIAERLRDRFQFLVSWRRLSAARHRTLREAMDWSYDLLPPAEQRLLRGLSVFSGGFTLASAAAVFTDGDDAAALELLQRLVEASLVVVDALATPTRYRLLETVRQYGAERLEAEGEAADAQRRHSRHYADLAEAMFEPLRASATQDAILIRLASERDNLRAALVRSRDAGDHEQVLRIAAAVWWFWWIRGELTEGRMWLATGLDGTAPVVTHLRAQSLLGLAGLSWAQAEYDDATKRAEAARAMFAELGNPEREGSALNTLGLAAHGRHDIELARQMFEAALERYRQTGVDSVWVRRSIAVTIDNLGSVAHELHADAEAGALYREALAMNAEQGNIRDAAMNELHIAILSAEAQDWPDARARLLRALPVYRQSGFLQYASETLEATSIVANGVGAPAEAAFLLGAAGRFREEADNPPVPFMRVLRERELEAARAALGSEAADAAFDAGRRAQFETAMNRAASFLGS